MICVRVLSYLNLSNASCDIIINYYLDNLHPWFGIVISNLAPFP